MPLDFKSLNVDVERNLVLEREREKDRGALILSASEVLQGVCISPKNKILSL